MILGEALDNARHKPNWPSRIFTSTALMKTHDAVQGTVAPFGHLVDGLVSDPLL